MKRFILLALGLVLLTACAPPRITDFSDRSVLYHWVDAREVSGNRLVGFEMRNLSVPESQSYYSMGWEKMGTGYLVWHAGVTPGVYEYAKMQMMSCAGPLCTNTMNEYNFGREGSAPGKVKVGTPGVYFAGCHAFKKTRGGFFRPGEFDTRKAPCGVSRQAMLQKMLQGAPTDHPIVAQRIRAAM